MLNCIFNENKLIMEDGGYAISSDKGKLTVTSSSFNNNGGHALQIYDSKYNINSNTFKSNNVAAYATFSQGSCNKNTLNGDKLSLNNTDYSSYALYEGMSLKIVNPIPEADTLPSSYDYRKLGYVTSVKNQGIKNSCWAFATCAAVESSILKTTGEEYDLSENVIFNSMLKYSKYGSLTTREFTKFTTASGSL